MRLLSVRPFAPSLLLLGGCFVTPLGCCRQRRATVHPLFPLLLLLVFVRIMYHQVVLDEEEEEGTIGISHTYYFCLYPPSRPCVGVGVLGTGILFLSLCGHWSVCSGGWIGSSGGGGFFSISKRRLLKWGGVGGRAVVNYRTPLSLSLIPPPSLPRLQIGSNLMALPWCSKTMGEEGDFRPLNAPSARTLLDSHCRGMEF